MLETRLLSIYLNDHRAGATAEAELARRTLGSNRGNKWGDALQPLCAEIEADLVTLDQAMSQLGIQRNPVKMVAAWGVEKLGRLKLNGRLSGYSPLSRVLELEVLGGALAGKGALWRTLDATVSAQLAELDLPALAERAGSQRQAVERLRLEAAADAFAEEGDRA